MFEDDEGTIRASFGTTKQLSQEAREREREREGTKWRAKYFRDLVSILFDFLLLFLFFFPSSFCCLGWSCMSDGKPSWKHNYNF